MYHTLIGTHKEHVGLQTYTYRNSIREHPRTGCDRQIIRNAIPLGCDTMKNTSLFCFFSGQCQKRKLSADPAERKRARFRALDGTRVIGAAPLIANYH
jgi:hypothetical protein